MDNQMPKLYHPPVIIQEDSVSQAFLKIIEVEERDTDNYPIASIDLSASLLVPNVKTFRVNGKYLITRTALPRLGFLYTGSLLGKGVEQNSLLYGGNLAQVFDSIQLLQVEKLFTDSLAHIMVRQKEESNLSFEEAETEVLALKEKIEVLYPKLQEFSDTDDAKVKHKLEQELLDSVAKLIEAHRDFDIRFTLQDDN